MKRKPPLIITGLSLALLAVLFSQGVKVGNITGCYYGDVLINIPCLIFEISIAVLILIILFEVYVDFILPKIRSRKNNKSNTVEKKVVYPIFPRRSYHAEYKVSENRDEVKQYVTAFLNKNNWQKDFTGYRYITKSLENINPNKEDVLQEHGIIIGGIKQDERLKGHSVAGMNMYPDGSNETRIKNMFYVSFVQGQDKVSIVRFGADEEDFSLFSEDLLNELKEVYTVKVLDSNIDISHRKVKNAKKTKGK